MICLPCGREFHDECNNGTVFGVCCCEPNNTDMDNKETTASKPDAKSDNRRRDEVSVSAGRKRAARDYDIDPTVPCDWRGRLNCGGGFKPVPGCIAGFQTDRHHGPDKNTTNNSSENIHLICKPCHNLWHRRNDPLYGENKCPDGIQSHEPKWATETELPLLVSKEI